MGSFNDYLENEILDHVFGGADYARPATLYVGLSSTTITDAASMTELSGNGYARVAVTNNSTNFPAASSGTKNNGTVITFPTASGAWATAVDFFISDASSAGNMLCYGTLSTSKTLSNGDVLSCAVNDLTITLT